MPTLMMSWWLSNGADGHWIFPKLLYTFGCSSSDGNIMWVKDAVNTSKHELKFLEQVNETNMLLHNSRILEVGTLDNDDLVDEWTTFVVAKTMTLLVQLCLHKWPKHARQDSIGGLAWPFQHQYCSLIIQQEVCIFGCLISFSQWVGKRGQRKKDVVARQKRNCPRRVVSFHGIDLLICRGWIWNLGGAHACVSS